MSVNTHEMSSQAIKPSSESELTLAHISTCSSLQNNFHPEKCSSQNKTDITIPSQGYKLISPSTSYLYLDEDIENHVVFVDVITKNKFLSCTTYEDLEHLTKFMQHKSTIFGPILPHPWFGASAAGYGAMFEPATKIHVKNEYEDDTFFNFDTN